MKFHEIFLEIKILTTLKKVKLVFFLKFILAYGRHLFITDTFSKKFERRVSGLRKRIR
jgi:hypothetical protein